MLGHPPTYWYLTTDVNKHFHFSSLNERGGILIRSERLKSVCVILCCHERKDTLPLLLRQPLYLAGVARYLLRHHKQQVGVVYPLGVNQPADGDNTVNSSPRLLCSLPSRAYLLMDQRDPWESYKAHLAGDVTVSLKLLWFNHQQSLFALTGRWSCLAHRAPARVGYMSSCLYTCVQTWSSCHSPAGCCRSCWDYLSSTASGSLHSFAL